MVFVGFQLVSWFAKNTLIVYYRSETILMNKSSSLDFMCDVFFLFMLPAQLPSLLWLHLLLLVDADLSLMP